MVYKLFDKNSASLADESAKVVSNQQLMKFNKMNFINQLLKN